jgi:hypothetical protein
MENKLNLRSLTRDELMATNGGEITKDTSFAYDLFYVIGLIGRGLYEFATTAADYQASLPPNLKK